MKLPTPIVYQGRLADEDLAIDHPDVSDIPSTTALEDKLGSPEVPTIVAPKNYPGPKATRKWNQHHLNAARTQQFEKLLKKIQRRELHKTSPRWATIYQALFQEIQKLRPTRKQVLLSRIAAGESPKNAAIICSADNYESLPEIKISDEQQRLLIQQLKR